MVNDMLEFSNRAAFREWLYKNRESSKGVWLLFGKKDGPVTIQAGEALEEALCFGRIDGQMQSLGSTRYKKYFSRRKENSKWSAKNKALAEKLEEQGKMTSHGREKIAKAKQNGQWDAPESTVISEEQVAHLSGLLKEFELAYTNFQAMPPSVRKTYTRAYYDAKTMDGRRNRFTWIVERLNKNLKPM